MSDHLQKALHSDGHIASGSWQNQLAPTLFPPPLSPAFALVGTYFPVKGLCPCLAIDQDVFRKELISYAVLANSSLSCAFSNK